MLPYIKIFGDISATVDMLSDEEAGRLLKALLKYANGSEVELAGQERLVFSMLRAQIDRDAAAYEAYCEKQRNNGAKGGRPRKPVVPLRPAENPVVSEENPKNPVVFNKNPKNPVVFSKTQKSQEKEKDIYITPPISPPDAEDLDDVQKLHQEIMEQMEYVGFDMTTAVIDKVIDLCVDYGKEAVLYGIKECAGVTGNKLRYLRKVVENYGKGKPQDDGRLDDDFLKTVVWG